MDPNNILVLILKHNGQLVNSWNMQAKTPTQTDLPQIKARF